MSGMRNKFGKTVLNIQYITHILLCYIIACRKLFIWNPKFISEMYHPYCDVNVGNFVHPIHDPGRNIKEHITNDLQATASTLLLVLAVLSRPW